MDVDYMSNKVRNNWRARATLGQDILEARNLRQDRRDLGLQLKILISYEVTTDAFKINRTKEILDIDVENVAPVPVPTGVGDNRSLSLETMSNLVWMFVTFASVVRLINLVNTVL